MENGQQVKKGDLLIETLEGSFDGYYMSGTEICAGQEGVLGSISVNRNENVQKDSVAAVIYPTDVMRVEGYVPEDYRSRIKEGDIVAIELETDESKVYQGKVVLVSSIASEGSEEVQYRVVAEFTPDDAVRFGMSTVITAGEEEKPAEEPEETAGETTENAAGDAGQDEIKKERPEGRPSGERPGKPGNTGSEEVNGDGEGQNP